MDNYEHLLRSLKFNKIGGSFVLETFIDNILSLNIMIASNVTTTDDEHYDKLKKYLDDTKSYLSIKSITIKEFEHNRLSDKLNINIIYDNGNTEYIMSFEKNFDSIFLEALRENRENKINSIIN